MLRELIVWRSDVGLRRPIARVGLVARYVAGFNVFSFDAAAMHEQAWLALTGEHKLSPQPSSVPRRRRMNGC